LNRTSFRSIYRKFNKPPTVRPIRNPPASPAKANPKNTTIIWTTVRDAVSAKVLIWKIPTLPLPYTVLATDVEKTEIITARRGQ